MTPSLKIRPPHFADNRWYSANPDRLEQEIRAYFAMVPRPAFSGKMIGLVAPHAGHVFSGHVAAAGFAQLEPGDFELVILIGPDHYGAAPGRVSTSQAGVWRTPLGDIPVDRAFLEALHREIDMVWLEQDREHSLEIELPFLQVALSRFRLIPLMMGNQSLATCRQLAQALDRTIRRFYPSLAGPCPVLLVASSDLSHFFTDKAARQLDKETLQFVLNLDGPGLIRHIEHARQQNRPLACGTGPIATTLEVAQTLGASQAYLLKYATSADVSADKSRVVGYAAVALTVGD